MKVTRESFINILNNILVQINQILFQIKENNISVYDKSLDKYFRINLEDVREEIKSAIEEWEFSQNNYEEVGNYIQSAILLLEIIHKKLSTNTNLNLINSWIQNLIHTRKFISSIQDQDEEIWETAHELYCVFRYTQNIGDIKDAKKIFDIIEQLKNMARNNSISNNFNIFITILKEIEINFRKITNSKEKELLLAKLDLVIKKLNDLIIRKNNLKQWQMESKENLF